MDKGEMRISYTYSQKPQHNTSHPPTHQPARTLRHVTSHLPHPLFTSAPNEVLHLVSTLQRTYNTTTPHHHWQRYLNPASRTQSACLLVCDGTLNVLYRSLHSSTRQNEKASFYLSMCGWMDGWIKPFRALRLHACIAPHRACRLALPCLALPRLRVCMRFYT